MGTLNDEILRAVSGPTVNDGLIAWYILGGASPAGTIEDVLRSYLATKVSVAGKTNQDGWMEYLGGLGHTGTLNDRLLQFWTGQ